MRTWLLILAALLPAAALAQSEGAPRIIIVPVAEYDAGTPDITPQAVPTAPPPQVIEQPAAPPPQVAPMAAPAEPTQRQFQATPADVAPPPTTAAPEAAVASGPGAMLDGHPREGPFLAGAGSAAFVAHHTLMGGLGVLATQMVPRLLTGNLADFTSNNARIAYLTGALVGSAIGFGASAWYQFYNWLGAETAAFGIVNSAMGAMFMVGFSNLFTNDVTPISWLALLGGEAAGWATAVLGGAEFPLNKGLLMTSGGAWAAIYTALILGIVATTGGGSNLQGGIDAILLTPAVGAGLMALASLKFNPSIGQIVRADLFGAGVGAGVLLLSAIILGVRFDLPTPYILGAIGAAGAMTVVSLLYAEAAEAPPAVKGAWWYESKEKQRAYSTVWW